MKYYLRSLMLWWWCNDDSKIIIIWKKALEEIKIKTKFWIIELEKWFIENF